MASPCASWLHTAVGGSAIEIAIAIGIERGRKANGPWTREIGRLPAGDPLRCLDAYREGTILTFDPDSDSDSDSDSDETQSILEW